MGDPLLGEGGLREDADDGANAARLYDSLQRLLDQPDGVVVLPAHDPGSPQPPVSAILGEVTERNEDLALDRDDFVRERASDIPEHPPNFQRIKRTNVGQEHVPTEELADLELGPNNRAAG